MVFQEIFILASDIENANHADKIFLTEVAIRHQNIGIKAAAAKRMHFAHGCSKLISSSLKCTNNIIMN